MFSIQIFSGLVVRFIFIAPETLFFSRFISIIVISAFMATRLIVFVFPTFQPIFFVDGNTEYFNFFPDFEHWIIFSSDDLISWTP